MTQSDKWEIDFSPDIAVIVRVRKPISAIERGGFKQLICVLESANNPPCVVLDLSDFEIVTSLFLNEVFRLWNDLRDKSGHLVLCCLSPVVSEVLKPKHVCPIPTPDSEQEALEKIGELVKG